jgi:hypothetical protein
MDTGVKMASSRASELRGRLGVVMAVPQTGRASKIAVMKPNGARKGC